MTKRFTVKTIFAFIVLYRCAYNFNFATEPKLKKSTKVDVGFSTTFGTNV